MVADGKLESPCKGKISVVRGKYWTFEEELSSRYKKGFLWGTVFGVGLISGVICTIQAIKAAL